MNEKLIDPETCPGALTESQVVQWRDQGFTFVRGLLPEALISTVAAAARDTFPAPGTTEADAYLGFGSKGALNFPSHAAGFNELTLHPALLAAVARLLAVDVCELRLTQSDLWPKYGRAERKGKADADDQRIHVDYPNHTLVHPSPWSRPEAVELIVYLDDHATTGGSTAVVPREGPDDPAYCWPIVNSPGIGELDFVNDRSAAEAYLAGVRPDLEPWRESLYARERHTRFEPGDVILYRHDTWHRGTPMREGALRLALNVTYRRREAEWISTLHVGWAWASYAKDKFLAQLLAQASLDQRAVLGFPQPGDAYWCDETIAAVAARYAGFGMDMTPYQRALSE